MILGNHTIKKGICVYKSATMQPFIRKVLF